MPASGFDLAKGHDGPVYIHVGRAQPATPFLPVIVPERQQKQSHPKILPQIALSVQNLVKRIGNESASKLNDGLVPPIVMTLLALLYNLLVLPVQYILLLPGMLVLGLFTLALGAYSLDRCIQERFTQPERAFHGMLAGCYFWFSADIANRLGQEQISIQTIAILMLLVTLVLTALWRTVLPIGVKFFGMVFLLNWIDRFLFTGPFALLKIWNIPAQIQTIYGWVALIIAAGIIVWLIFHNTARVYRLWAAACVWFFSLQAITLLCGWSL